MGGHTEDKTGEWAGAVVLYSVICAYQCSSLWQGANKSAKQQ